MTRKKVQPDKKEKNQDDNNYLTVVTGGPLKYYNRRRVRKVFAGKIGSTPFQPITAAWFQVIIQEITAGRHLKQISHATLANLLGTRQSEISQHERGQTNPTVETLERLFLALDLLVEVKISPK